MAAQVALVGSELQDKNFDDFAERFGKNIYEHTKGKIRLQLLLEDFHDLVPFIEEGGLDILDAGCGIAYFSSMLANAQHKFTLCDISASMLAQARERFDNISNVDAEFHQLPVQEIHHRLERSYDVVCLHAVLEWLAEPKRGLESVFPLIKPGGYFSLLFYNRYSLVYKHLIMGNYRRLNDRDVNGFGGTLTPIHPLDPYEVEHWVESLGLTILRKTGIRTFFDYQMPDVKNGRSFEDTYEMEQRYARQQPFTYLGRYIHFLCQKPVNE